MNGYEFACRLYDIRKETGKKVTTHWILSARTKDLNWSDVLAASKEAIEFGLVERLYESGAGGTRISYRLTREGFRREYQRRYQKERKDRLKSENTCIDCACNPAKPKSGGRCKDCAARCRALSRAYQRTRRAALKPFNICPVCCTRERMYDPDKAEHLAMCGYCSERDAESKEKRNGRNLLQAG